MRLLEYITRRTYKAGKEDSKAVVGSTCNKHENSLSNHIPATLILLKNVTSVDKLEVTRLTPSSYSTEVGSMAVERSTSDLALYMGLDSMAVGSTPATFIPSISS